MFDIMFVASLYLTIPIHKERNGNKIMKKRIISAFILASMALSLAACGSDTTDAKDTTEAPVTGDTLPAGIAKQNYGGTVNILMPECRLYLNYFDPGDDLTDIMNKALFDREIKVEDYLGVDITYQRIASNLDTAPTLAAAISTNDDLYQISLNDCVVGNNQLITSGYLLDMNDLDIDFTGEWFNQNANDALSVEGMQFFCVSDYMLPDPNVMLFNKDMIEVLNLEDPYQLVRDGKWTIDKMTEMSLAATADNGDTVWDAEDTYGFSCPGDWYCNSFIFSADVPIIDKNENGEFFVAFENERTYSLMEKLDVLINGPGTFKTKKEGGKILEEVNISSGRCLFTLLALDELYTTRNISVDFGILPYPKLNEEQEEYISNDWTGLLCVPISLSEESYKMVGDVIELLSYHSAEEVLPTYLDVTLGTKLSRDEESKEMLDIVFGNCTFNAGMNYFGLTSQDNQYHGFRNLFYIVPNMIIKTGEANTASFLAANIPMAEASLAEFNEAVSELEN